MKKVNKKKQKKLRKTYLIFLILMTGIFLTSSTYAWFTVNRIVSIDSLNVRVEAQGGLEISSDGRYFKSYVTGDELVTARDTYTRISNQLPSKLEPVSTGGVLEKGRLMLYYGSVTNNINGDYVLNAERANETSGSDGVFLAFDIFLKTTKDSYLYLTNESSVKYVGDKIPGIENATRLAFLEEGTTVATSSLDVVQSLNNASDNDVYIWEPNYDVHNAYGIKHAAEVYNITVNNSNNAPVKYDGIISNISNIPVSSANASNYPNYFKTVNVNVLTEANNTSNKQLFYLKAGITKVRVYIWIEGQDVDCEDYSSVGNLDFKFQFSTNPS